ncbi:hypothetical protein A2U01_0009176 [Trifolium medium]|uniref:Uncharacterized protein n=1 Tax=Trifolium medium TaxID=97028 RepID=A0A392ML90_9FABA|nr:hypothetical protein [Trifolium medium]
MFWITHFPWSFNGDDCYGDYDLKFFYGLHCGEPNKVSSEDVAVKTHTAAFGSEECAEGEMSAHDFSRRVMRLQLLW